MKILITFLSGIFVLIISNCGSKIIKIDGLVYANEETIVCTKRACEDKCCNKCEIQLFAKSVNQSYPLFKIDSNTHNPQNCIVPMVGKYKECDTLKYQGIELNRYYNLYGYWRVMSNNYNVFVVTSISSIR